MPCQDEVVHAQSCRAEDTGRSNVHTIGPLQVFIAGSTNKYVHPSGHVVLPHMSCLLIVISASVLPRDNSVCNPSGAAGWSCPAVRCKNDPERVICRQDCLTSGEQVVEATANFNTGLDIQSGRGIGSINQAF